MLITAEQALTAAGTYDELRAAAVAKLEASRNPGDGFSLTSRYLVVTVRP